EPSKVGPGLFGDRGDVGEIRERQRAGACQGTTAIERVDAEPEDRQAAVIDAKGSDAKPEKLEGVGLADRVRREARDPRWVGVDLAPEDIVVDAFERVERGALRVDIDRGVHEDVESTNIIESEDVVEVSVREEDRVATSHAVPDRLLAQIRGC